MSSVRSPVSGICSYSNAVTIRDSATMADSPPPSPGLQGLKPWADRKKPGTKSAGLTQPALAPHPVVRRFLRDHDVVRVAFAQTGGGDLDKLGVVFQGVDVSRTDIPHRRAEPADELVNEIRKRALVGDAPF